MNRIRQAGLSANNDNLVLWSSEGRSRHFLVPDTESLGVGAYEIRTVFGDRRRVIVEAILPFEVTHEEAKAWIKRELNGVLGEVKSAFADKLAAILDKSSDLGGTHTQDRNTTQTGETPGLDLLSALSDKSKTKMREDPVELIGGVTQALEDFGEILRRSQTGSEVDLAEAKARMKRMRETFNRHGIDVSDRADSLPDKLREFSSRRGDRESDTDATKSSDPGPHSPEEKAQQ